MASSLSNLMARFRQVADPAQAVKMAAYMKNRFPFFGIPQPQRKALTREFLKESRRVDLADVLAWMRELYEQPERECHYLALDLLKRNYQRLMYEDFQCTFGLIDQNAWWDSVDALRKSMSLWVKANRQHLDEVMHKLLAADSIWWRRVALTFQLSWKEQTDTAWLERAILQNMDDGEFFIQKAIGWALRDYSKTNPEWVRRFLVEHALSNLAQREGSKYI